MCIFSKKKNRKGQMHWVTICRFSATLLLTDLHLSSPNLEVILH